MRENRPLPQDEAVGVPVIDVTAGDVAGQQIGRELDAFEIQPQRRRKARRDQRLRQAGVILQQHVSAGRENRRQQPRQQLPLADDGLFDFGKDARAPGLHSVNFKGHAILQQEMLFAETPQDVTQPQHSGQRQEQRRPEAELHAKA